MEFVTFIEQNHKEHETFVFYLQWTGNEEALTWLYDTIQLSSSDGCGDYSVFDMNIQVKFTEEMVDQHCKLHYGCYTHMFNKVTGICNMGRTLQDEVDGMDRYDIGRWLDEQFYASRIQDWFQT